MKILHVVGARPNFMKAAPVISACAKHNFTQLLIHTGQHYDENMSGVFFQELGLPKPDINLGVGSGSDVEKTANIMIRTEKVLKEYEPDWVVVYGDVNSTLATAIVCAKLFIPIVHVEAGLRSFDRRMPEEINRQLTDQASDLLFTPSEDGNINLLREGISEDKIHLVGNVMIDTLINLLPLTKKLQLPNVLADYKEYALVTLHRPSNVDDPSVLKEILKTLVHISQKVPIIFPVHPRTQKCISELDLIELSPHLHIIDPLGYLDFLNLIQHAKVVLTDSGGIQEETTFLGVPCLTLRENTERPVTVTLGTNKLIGFNYLMLEREVEAILAGSIKKGKIPPLWDGRAAERIANVLAYNE